MEPNKTQHNSQTALFAIAIILALGVGFYMGYQTGYVNGGSAMHGMMDAESGMGEHMHTMMHADGATHEESSGTSVGGAIMQLDAAADQHMAH